MSLRHAVGFLLTQRFSPRVIRSFHSSDPRLHGAAAAAVAAAAFAGVGGALAVQYCRKGPDDDEPATRKKEKEEGVFIYKEGEMEERFEIWMKEFNKTYRNKKEKTMRFQVFKETIKWIASQPPSSQKCLLPGNCFADLRSDELPCSQCCININPDNEDDPENKFITRKK